MKPIATDTADFPSLRKDGCIYVDKTMYMHRLISTKGSKLVFVSRPRRFGKSLTISALKAIFQGRREFFEGLAIDKTDWAWEKYPVIHFEFNDVATDNLQEFEKDFAAHIKKRLSDVGYAYDVSNSVQYNFGEAIEQLSAANGGKGVVILIDEYDAPVGHTLDNIEVAEAVRARLSALYSQMKNRTGDIRFLLMTGVSKFTKLSVFSALNNIVDISQDNEYATMFGYTEEELSANFDEHLRDHAEKMGKSYDDYRAQLKKWYNGFRFAKNIPTTVYNPISVAYTLFRKEPGFSATWSSTGRPSMLMNYLKREDMLYVNPDRIEDVDSSEFDVAELRHLKPVAMLFQAGYLTIKDYNSITESYTLGVPDEEVRRDLCTLMTGVAANETMAWAGSLGKKLLGAKWDVVFNGLKSLYAAMAYGSKEASVHENSYGRCLSFLLASCGFDFTMEAVQANGRADIIAKHPAMVCIFELKVDEPVDKAFKQIHEKGYAEPYRAETRPVWLVGLSFNSKTRNLVDYGVEKFEAVEL
ncbi:MAG: AAA family ATPase [Kiritimatiellae bacterium]|nr:AAA family ATPase [Kiritimatiellia bacterium]MBR6588494.1 AAA family ATPase [Kiritimatiellia bacterium]